MELTKGTKWLCENAKTLEKFSGKCVMFSANDGLVTAETKTLLKKMNPASFVFHVPSKEELVSSPLPIPVRQVSR